MSDHQEDETTPVVQKSKRGGKRAGAGRKRKSGLLARPTPGSGFSAEVAELVLDRIASGELLRDVCSEPSMPDRRTVWRWVRDREDFRIAYRAAEEFQMDAWKEEIVEISKNGRNDWIDENGVRRVDHDHIARSRLRVDTLKFLMSKIAAKRYGDRQVIDLNVREDLASELEKARQRALAISEVIDGDARVIN